MTMKLTETITRTIPFCDIDCIGVMWHGNYIRYFEEARHKLFEKLGFSHKSIHARGYEMPIISMKIKYISPCIYNQKINISATLEKSEHLLIVTHKITDFQDKKTLSLAETRLMAFCVQTKRGLFKLPDFIGKILT